MGFVGLCGFVAYLGCSMNLAEYSTLDNGEIPGDAKLLYVMHFRRLMNYDTGRVSISLAGLRQCLEFTPPYGSNVSASKPSISKVRHLIDVLVRHGLIRCVVKGDKAIRKPAVFLCVLATTNLVGVNEERHGNDTGTARNQKTTQPAPDMARSNIFKINTNTDEQHVSDISDLKDIYTREALVWGDEFERMSQQAMLICNQDELVGYFNSFRFSTKDDGAFKGIGVHLKAWRQYCVTIRNNLNKDRGDSNETNQQSGPNRSPTSAAASTMRRSLALYEQQTAGEFDAIDQLP
jgi:hypothetical protein